MYLILSKEAYRSKKPFPTTKIATALLSRYKKDTVICLPGYVSRTQATAQKFCQNVLQNNGKNKNNHFI